ncbi:MAG TPA: CpsB/CapC family capsule biosynthesis tyrosine phosphatase [Gemmatimonadaceae bacterium]
MIDFHNHLIPAVDDGAADLADSRFGMAAMVDQGATTIIATPHFRGSMAGRARDRNAYLAVIDKAWEELRELGRKEFPKVRLERGAEVMLDVPSPDLSDSRLRLAGTAFVLCEFPFMRIPPHSIRAIATLADGGVHPVVAHPERYSNMMGNLELMEDWKAAGAFLQVNCGSLTGQYGAAAKRIAWDLVRRGVADYLSSDYHARGRCQIADCAAALTEAGGKSQLRALTVTNPQRMLRGEPPLPVAPFTTRKPKLWRRLLRLA